MKVSKWTVALALCVGAGCGGDAQVAPRNLLFVSIDTLRADHVSCYGYGRETTPHLDALAARSQRFASCWSVLPTTLPAHTAMFTSLHPKLLGAIANGFPVAQEAYTLAERLRERGFATGAFVSAVPLHPRFGLDQGFDVYDHPQGEERRGDETRARAEEWLTARGDERFFAFVHLFDPHTWYDAPEAERALFGAPPGPLPPERVFLQRPEAFGATQRAALVDAYDAEIRFADAQLGALLELLERSGLADSTLVVVTSDHGETLDELIDAYGYGYDHGEFLHARELHVPLVVHVPGGRGARVHAAAVSQLDLLPTLLELLGVPRKGLLLGRSLVPLIDGGELPPRPVFAERRTLTRGEVERPPSPYLAGEEYAVGEESWLFVTGAGRGESLHDLRADPAAAADVAGAHADECERLSGLLESWRETQEALGAQGPGVQTGEVDPALLEALRALGYAAD
ncbi:MAG TPA: sulfatase [Planctomycetota bacterium]|nr:sulfatase [Planctomycetota bacterium]